MPLLKFVTHISLIFITTLVLAATFSVSHAYERRVVQELDTQTFYYTWRDHTDKEHKFNFSYSNDVLFNHYRRFKAFNTQEYLDTIHLKVTNTLKQFDSRKYSVETERKERSIEYKIISKDKVLLKEIKDRVEITKQNARKSYLQKHYYADLKATWAIDAVRPDLPRFIKDSYNYIQPISQAIKGKFGNNVRPQTIINFVLSWLQAMPVSSLPDRFHHSGENYKPPLKLIRQNHGDVDSKTALAAALLKAVYPRLTVAIITTPRHSLIGLNLPVRKDEKYIDINGLKFLLGETSGTTQYPIAKVNQSTWNMLNSKQYIVDIL